MRREPCNGAPLVRDRAGWGARGDPVSAPHHAVLQRARDDRRRAVNPDDVIDAGDAPSKMSSSRRMRRSP
jgi:hypothetical protein